MSTTTIFHSTCIPINDNEKQQTTKSFSSLVNISQEINTIDSIISLYKSNNEYEERERMGYLGCVKQVADTCLNKVDLLLKLTTVQNWNQEGRQSAANVSMFDAPVFDNLRILLRHAVSNILGLSFKLLVPATAYTDSYDIVEKIQSLLKSCCDKDQTITENSAGVRALCFAMRRCVLLWESCVQELFELVSLGDTFIRQGAFFEAGIVYHEATDLLLLVNVPHITLHEECDSLCRLALLGYGHTLFAQEMFIDCAKILRLGLQYFPAFPALLFNPYSIYEHNTFTNLLHNIETQIKEMIDKGIRDKERLNYLRFVLAFYLHFTEDDREKSRQLFEEILKSDLTFHKEIDYFLNSLDINFSQDKDEVLSPISPFSETYNRNQINMNDLSLKQLEHWTIRMLNPKKGISIKNRKYRFKTYEKCFVGSEAVTWLVKNGNVTRSEALIFAQRIMDRSVIRNVMDGNLQIKDDFIFYEFQTPLLEHCFTPIIKQGYLLMKGLVKWNRIYVILFESTICFFEQKGGKIKTLQRLDKTNVIIGLPPDVFARLFKEDQLKQKNMEEQQNSLIDGEEPTSLASRTSLSSIFRSDFLMGVNNEDEQLFYLTIGLEESIALKTESVQSGLNTNERDSWVQSFKNLPYVKIMKVNW